MIPSIISDAPLAYSFPAHNLDILGKLEFLLVENIKTTRRFFVQCGLKHRIDQIQFEVVNKKTSQAEKQKYLDPMMYGHDMGFISEAGAPAIADPGAGIAWMAHQQGYKVVPLIGPNSILLALMASGLNGQSFTFHGYLPIDKNKRKQSLKLLEKEAGKTGYTQIFMETPYRNQQLLDDILRTCNPQTRLCIACDITSVKEEIITMQISNWQKMKFDVHKRLCIFLLNV